MATAGKMVGVQLATRGNFLVPATSPVTVLLMLAFAALMIWSLFDAASHRRWGWFWSMFVFGPFAAVAWMLAGRPSSGRQTH